MAQTSARQTDLNGFMIVRGCPLSREGIYEYSAAQISPDFDPENPNRIVKVFRPAEEVASPEAINSFKSVPLIDDHTMMNGIGGKHPDYAAPEEVGIEGVLTDNVWYDESDGWMKGDVKVFTRRMLDVIQRMKDDLSLGFGCLFYVEPGTWNGQEYEVVQRRIRGNHLAVVDDGRIEGARIIDAMCFDSVRLDLLTYSTEGTNVIKGKKIIKGSAADSALEKLKALVPALEQIIAEGQAELSGGDNAQPEVAAEPEVAAAPAEAAPPEGDADPSADPEAVAQPEVAAEPEAAAEPTNEKPEDVQVLVQQVEALLAQLKDMLAPAPEAPEAAAAPATDSELDDANPNPPEGAQTHEASGKDAELNGAMVATDNIDPTAGVCSEAVDNADPANPAMDDSDPSAMEAAGQDAALTRFYADLKTKNELYGRVSKVIGAFDGSAMDSKSMAVYAAKKLGLNCANDQAVSTVNVYLDGLAKGQKAASEKAAHEAAAMDARRKDDSLDAYLKEVK
jgi:hypothetical protein